MRTKKPRFTTFLMGLMTSALTLSFLGSVPVSAQSNVPATHTHYYEMVERYDNEFTDTNCSEAPCWWVKMQCLECGASYDTEFMDYTIAPYGHNYVDGVCTVCHEESEYELPAGQHTHNFVKLYENEPEEASCTKAAYTFIRMGCQECGQSYSLKIVDESHPALGHDYKNGRCVRCTKKDPDYVPGVTDEKQDTTTEQKTDLTASQTDFNRTKVPLAKPVLKKISLQKGKKFTISWKKVKDAAGYQIQYSRKSNFSGKTSKNLPKNKTSFSVKKAKGKTCYVRIRSYKKESGKKIYSSWTMKKIKLK